MKKLSLSTLFLTVFIDMLGIGIAIPITTPLILNPANAMLPLDWSDANRTILLGWLIASFSIAAFFGGPILGALSDKHGRKKILSLSLIGTLLGYILFAIGIMEKNIFLLFASRILDGFSAGNITCVQSAIADVSKDAATKARNFGILGMAFGLGFILGPYIGAKLADASIVSWFTYQIPFYFAALLSLINFVQVQFYFHETLDKPITRPISLTTGISNLYHAFNDKQLRWMFITFFLYYLGFNFYTQFFTVFLFKKLHFSISDIGNYMAYVGFLVATAQGLIVRRLAGKYSNQTIIYYALFGLSIALFLTIFPTHWWQLIIITPLMALCQGSASANVTTIVSMSSNEQGKILGLNSSIVAASAALPPLLAGYFDAINIHLPLIISSILVFSAWYLFTVKLKQKLTTASH